MKLNSCIFNITSVTITLVLFVCVYGEKKGNEIVNHPYSLDFDRNKVKLSRQNSKYNLNFCGSNEAFAAEIKNYVSKKYFIQSSLMISPIMSKIKPILSELTFEYSNENIRGNYDNAFKLESFDKVINTLFELRGNLKHCSGILRYGFFNALFSLLNERIQNNLGFKYFTNPDLLNNSLSSSDCIELLKISNAHFERTTFFELNSGVFRIICDRVTNSEIILEMESWKKEIFNILKSIKDFISSIEERLRVKREINMEVNFHVVPKVSVTGNEIKQRYVKIVSYMNNIKRKEPSLFGSLIFTRKMAVKITTQYLPNGDELAAKCIEIISHNNPALMREKYQEGVIKHICKVTMGK